MENTALAGHVHLWRIQNDDKTGVCKCGAVKEFIGARQFEINILEKSIRKISQQLLEELIGVK